MGGEQARNRPMTECNVISNKDARREEFQPSLSLKFFGPMIINDASGSRIVIRGRKARAVLALLALSAGPVLRDTLINKMWSRSPRYNAQMSLRQSIYEIQDAFKDLEFPVLVTERHYLKLDHQAVRIDVKAVESVTVNRPNALMLMRGVILEDISGIDPELDIWLENKRKEVREHATMVAKAVLNSSSEHHNRITAAEYLIYQGNTIDHAWRALIDSYIKLGQYDAAKHAQTHYQSVGNKSMSILDTTKIYHAPMKDSCASIEIDTKTCLNDAISSIIHESASVKIAIANFKSFDSLSERLAKGLTEEIIASLSKFRGLSCFSSLTLKVAGNIAESSGSPDVDFLLEGSVQQGPMISRITVHLADIRNHGEIIWSQRFDRILDDHLTIQSDVASEIVAQIDPQLTLREGLRAERIQCDVPTSFELTLRALPAIYRLDHESFIQAGEMLSKAVSRDPSNGAAHAWLAYWHLLLLGQGWAINPLDAEARTWELAKRAIVLDPGDARALALAGHVQAFIHRRIDEAMALHDRALSINPNLPIGWLFSGLAHTYAGFHDEAVRRIRYAIKLSPFDPHAFFFEMGLTLSLSLSGNDRQAIDHGRNAAAINPSFSSTFKAYLSALGFMGGHEAKESTLAHLLSLEPGLTVSSALKRSPLVRQVDREKFIEGLRLGGLPK